MSYCETIEDTLQAGQPKRLAGSGRIFALLQAAAPVSVRFLDMTGHEIGFARNVRQGLQVKMPRVFNRAELISDTAQAVAVIFATEDVDIGRISGDVTATLQRAAAIANLAPVVVSGTVATLVYAASAPRQVATLANPDSNTGRMYIGGPDLTIANAARWIDPGESYELIQDAAAAIYCIAEVDGEEVRADSGA